jgi:thermostable 8-oxoguanine DNA glycosylase
MYSVRSEAQPDWSCRISTRRHLEIEAIFEDLANALGIPPDEPDLLPRQRETGYPIKWHRTFPI